MIYPNRKFIGIFLILTFLIFTVKLFTLDLSFKDDPSSVLAFRVMPSLENRVVIETQLSESHYFPIVIDENAFLGRTLYFLLVDKVIYALFVLDILLLLLYSVKVRKT